MFCLLPGDIYNLLILKFVNNSFFFLFPSYREKAKKDAAAVGNHVAKLLQSVGRVSCWAHCAFGGQHSPT